MKEGNVVLAPLLQADGVSKIRPGILLREMRPYKDFLVCGISTQLHQQVEGFDQLVLLKDLDFASSGLKSQSLIRWGFLTVLKQGSIIGSIGSISPDRHRKLLETLSNYLVR
jgi:mRNA interferase MazF